MRIKQAGYYWVLIINCAFILSFDLKYDLVGITFFLLMAQSTVLLFYSMSGSVNLLTVYFVFTLAFLNLLPWLHYSTGHVIWRSAQIFESTYIIVNLVIFLSGVAVFFSYVVTFGKQKPAQVASQVIRTKKLHIYILLILSLFGFVTVFYLNDFSVANLLFRGLVDEQRVVVVESSSLALMLGLVSRLIPVFCFFYAFTQIKGEAVKKFMLFILMALSVFPTGVARYMAAFTYIPVILLFFPAMRNASVFAVSLLLALIFAFPFLDQFRYFSGIQDLSFLPHAEFFYAAHFDAYENFSSAIEGDFVSYGYQLLGALLFFIPRDSWPDKPVGSGYEMAQRLGYEFNNISMPFLGEGYVNFGFVGVVLFAVLIGYSMARADKFYSQAINVEYKASYSKSTYYFMVGAIFFLLRGDMLSSVAYISAGLVVALFVGRTMRLANLVQIKLY